MDPNWNITLLHPMARTQEILLLGWNIDSDNLQYIPEHWLRFPDPPRSLYYLCGIFYIILFLAGIIGNGLVIWVFLSSSSLRTPSNVFVVNLAISDFLMTAKSPIAAINLFTRGFTLGHPACQAFALIGSLSGISAGMTNAFIAQDRYNVIARPLDGKLSHTKAIILTLIIWLYTMPWAVFPLFEIWGRYSPEGFLNQCTFDYITDDFDIKIFVISIFICSYVFPVTMIIIYYSQIVKHVFIHEKNLRQQAKKMNVESLRSNVDKTKESAEIRIAKAAITICFMFIVSWTPYAVMALTGTFGNRDLLTPTTTMIPAMACKIVACIDPYIYAISHPKYRLELQKKLPWLAINEKSPETTSRVTENIPPT